MSAPIYSKISQAIKEDILSGKYPNGTYLPSERILSEQYQVERTTIRRALQELVDDEIIRKFPGAGSKVVISPDVPAVTPQISPGICFVLPGTNDAKISEPFMADLFRKVHQECFAHGYNLIYCEASSTSDLHRILNSPEISAIIWVSAIDPQIIESANSRGLPSICLCNEIYGQPSINSDNIGGAMRAVENFVAHRHRKIAMINGSPTYYTAQQRMQGYRLALMENSIPYRSEYVKNGDWSYGSGYVQAAALLKLQDRPTAIFCANDTMALGAMNAALEAGLSIPKDLSIIGFDDIDAAKYSVPSLTTFRCNTVALAQSVVSTILNMFSRPSAPTKLLVPVELIERGTVSWTP